MVPALAGKKSYPEIGMPLLANTRATILLAFKALPLLLISFIGFLAIGLGNVSLFLLFLGHAIVVPVATEICHLGTSTLVTTNEISQLVPLVPTTGATYNSPTNIIPSYWMAHLSFFFGYILTNAVTIYTGYGLPEKAKGAPDWAVDARTTRGATLITTTLVLWFTFSWLRWYLTGAESAGGMTVAFLLLGGLGSAWYFFAQLCGARNADIFGVSQQMLSQGDDTAPMTCVYQPKP